MDNILNFAIVLELFVLLLCYLSPFYTFDILFLLIIDVFPEEWKPEPDLWC